MSPQEPSLKNQPVVNGKKINTDRTTKSSKTWLIIAAVFLAAVTTLYIVASRQSEQRQGVEAMQVSITSEGFNPSTALIKPGTTVRWTNLDQQPHWVASNPHPEHDGLPGLDAGEPIGPDNTYTYTFNETGTFGYHDHLNPELNGTIIVE